MNALKKRAADKKREDAATLERVRAELAAGRSVTQRGTR